MLKILPFQKEHFLKIRVREPNLSMAQGIGNIAQFAEVYQARGPAFTIFDGDLIVGSIGIVMIWKGFGEAWVYVSDDVERHKKEFHRVVKNLLDESIKNLNIRRVQAVVEESYITGCKWAERLGFVEEGRMRNYGVNGETYILYARVRDEG